ncbi:MAG: hypothetical protein H6557_34190 [Lewinellaceae bacterium]|nr:hypothetical protein [Lewinellaceae bacterium]
MKKDHINVYAFNEKREPKHISKVESGRKGYYCMGCDAEVEARKGDIRSHYFAHVPTDVGIERKCTFSDETYRHKLAKEILQRIKQIKVPALYKYPPVGEEGKPYKIRDSWMVKAATVRIERQIYENESGEICSGQHIDFEKDKGKFLLIQPDAVFFDEKNKPVLLIEIVATHKISPEKLSRIRRLGIDTVQARIPKDSPEGIEASFYKTERTQWIYNHEQETTTYVRVPEGDPEGVLPTDGFQRKLFEAAESFECRRSQINNLIRGIGKCLESEPYRKSKASLGRELQRVKGNTERSRVWWQELQRRYEKEMEESFRLEEEALGRGEAELERAESRFQEYCKGLETRYYQKRELLGEEERRFEPACQAEIERIEGDLEALGADGAGFEERMEEIRREEGLLEQRFRREEGKINELTRRAQAAFDDLERRRKEPSTSIGALEDGIRRAFDEARRRVESQYRAEEESIPGEFEALRRRTVEAVENRIGEGELSIHRRVKDALDQGRLLLSISQGQSGIQRLRAIKQLLDSRAYKDWV